MEHLPSIQTKQISVSELRLKLSNLWDWKKLKLTDNYYFYPSWEDWDKVFLYVMAKLPKYVPNKFDCEVAPDLAYAMGLFFADGTCGSGWSICNTKPELLEKCILPLERTYPELTFRIETYPSEAKGRRTNYGYRNDSLYHLQVGIHHNLRKPHQPMLQRGEYGARSKFIAEWRYLFYLDNYKQVPNCIDDSEAIAKKAFLEGAIDGDGYKKQKRLYIYGLIGATGLIKLMLAIGWDVSRYPEKRNLGNYVLRYNDNLENLTRPQAHCENFAGYIRVKVAELFGINCAGDAEGYADLGRGVRERHGWTVFFDGEGLYQIESQKRGGLLMDIDDPNYCPDELVMG